MHLTIPQNSTSTLKTRLFQGLLLSSLVFFSNGNSWAASELTISGSLDLSTVNPTGNVTQSGKFSTTQAGNPTDTSFNQLGIIAGAKPLTGVLTDIGDGFTATTDLDAGFDSEYAYIANLVIDFTNGSLTDDYKVSLNFNFNHSVDADIDAYAESNLDAEIDLVDIIGGSSDISSDTDFGDEKNGNLTSFGNLISDNGNLDLDLIILAGTGRQLTVDWGWEGGVFAAAGASKVDFSAEVKITNIMNLTTVPLPGALLFFTSSLFGIGLFGRHRNAIANA